MMEQVAQPTTVRRIALTLMVAAQPLLFGAAIVLARFTIWPGSPGSLTRPLLVVLVGSACLLLLARLLTRNWWVAALVSSGIVAFTLREVILGLILVVIPVWLAIVHWQRRRVGNLEPLDVSRLAQASGLFAALLLLTSAYSAVAAHMQGSADRSPTPGFGVAQLSPNGPNIYLVLLDGYPRADSLRETFGYDNQSFIASLESLGFEVAEHARANYNKTWLSLASVLNGAYIADLLGDREPPRDAAGQVRWASSMINDSALLDYLRASGYSVRAIPSAFSSAALNSADEFDDHGQLTEFEARLIWNTPWMNVLGGPLTRFMLTSHEAAVRANLAETARLARENEGHPQFVLAHILAPHLPFVFNNSGTAEPSVPECFPMDCSLWAAAIEELHLSKDDFGAGLIPQLDGLNSLVLSAVNDVVRSDPDAVVVIMSDHGLRYSLADSTEQFRTLLATRTPGASREVPADESNVNILRWVISDYLGAEAPQLPYKSWDGDWANILDMWAREPTD